MQTVHKTYSVDTAKIGFIRFIFEAYEGVAIATTLDAKAGLIRLAIPPERLDTAVQIVDALKKDFKFDEI
ncbi:MAG: DUF4911 domain-containing protein [Desulfobacterales bacterium]|nr:DUF4911 domain-containing protein [Desulfobacterales bacterium]